MEVQVEDLRWVEYSFFNVLKVFLKTDLNWKKNYYSFHSLPDS